jgi:integrase
VPRKPIVKRSSSIFPYRGKWRIQYLDLQGQVRTKTAATKEDAYKQLGALEHLKASGELPRRSQDLPSVSEWLDYWLELRKPELREVTWQGFEASARLHIKPALGELGIDAVSVSHIEGLYRALAKDKKLSSSTIHRMHAMLRHSFTMAFRHGYLSTNPVSMVKLPKREKAQVETLSLDELKLVLTHLQTSPPIVRLRWLLALRLGMRQGECLALTMEDFDLGHGVVRINKTLNRLPELGFVLRSTKSEASCREIPLDKETFEVARLVAESRGQMDASTLVFTAASGGPVDAKSDYLAWQTLLKSVNVEPKKLHSARHTAATMMVQFGVDIKSVQELLGHSSPSFTMATYVHPSKEHLRGAVEQLSSALRVQR